MKKTILLALLIICIITPTVAARKGVGIVWNTETELVMEGTTHCVEYGIYNPWEEDVTAQLSVSGGLTSIIKGQDSEQKFITAQTFHEDAVPIQLCFDIAKVYTEDCSLGPFLCEQKCEAEQVEYEGLIEAKEKESGSTSGTGSLTALGVSVPLKLKVRCDAHDRNYTAIYASSAAVLGIALAIMLMRRRRKI